MVDENLQILRRINLTHLERRDDDMPDVPSFHPFEKLIIQRFDTQTGYLVVRALVVVRNKTYRMIRRVTCRTKHLCNRHTGILRAVNHHARTAVAVLLQQLAESLHRHAKREKHHERYRHINGHHRVEDRMPTGGPFHDEVEKDDDRACRQVRQKHFNHIDEGRVTQDARESVEHQERQRLNRNDNEVLLPDRQNLRVGGAVVEIVTSYPRAECKSNRAQQQIQQQNAPTGEVTEINL